MYYLWCESLRIFGGDQKARDTSQLQLGDRDGLSVEEMVQERDGQVEGLLLQAFVVLGRKGHDDVIKWKHFPRYWPFVRGIHRSPVNSPHKGQ